MRHIEKRYQLRSKLRIALALVILANLFMLPFLIGRMQLLNLAWDSKSWPYVLGTITEDPIASDSCATSAVESWRTIFCTYSVKYTYSVGIQYENTRVAYLGRPAWKEVRNAWSRGSLVEVYYSPDFPRESVLHPGYFFYDGAHFVVITELVLGLICLLALVWVGIARVFIEFDPDLHPDAFPDVRLRGKT